MDIHANDTMQKYDLSMTLLQREIDHLKWAQALGLFVHDHKATELTVSSDATKCAFGRWFYSDERAQLEKVNPELKPLLASIEQPHKDLHGTAVTIQKLKKEAQQEKAEEVYNIQTLKSLSSVQEILLGMREKVKTGIDTNRKDLIEDINFTKLLVYVSTVVSMALAVVLSLVISRAISNPLKSLAECSTVIAGGDLSKQCVLSQNDEIGQLSRSMGAMVAGLKDKIAESDRKAEEADALSRQAREAQAQAEAQEHQIKDMLTMIRSIANESMTLSDNLSDYAEQLSSQVEQVKQGTEVQKNRLSEAASAMEQMNATVLDVARNASEAAESAGKAQEKAREGAGIVIESVKAIDRVSSVTANLRSNMNELGTQAQSIGQVMNVISDIADQTNLLALNAAIEAARAGEAGRGFAVVADEVRKLAEKTMGATQDVGGKIRAIQDSVGQSVRDMEAAATAVDRSNELAGASGKSLEEIVALTSVNTQNVQSIAAAAEEQSSASEHIHGSLSDVNGVAHETESGMSETVAIVGKLADMAGQLKELIAQMHDGDSGARGSRRRPALSTRPGMRALP
ncbi:methyl-accepting chemotaxis protein [Fundidesulfovibrio terrae]|uniref:methyl-accepting chemotaxis protein n=1 Tax=Fundidesulfovibrio terrae TaxID=2922866 RepID=UPI001FAF3A48